MTGTNPNDGDDKLIVYGARCIWWDSIDKAGSREMRDGLGGLPVCPYCGSPLFQMSEPQWWNGVERYQRDGHAGYRAFVEWWRGKCFLTMEAALAEYTAKTGNVVGTPT